MSASEPDDDLLNPPSLWESFGLSEPPRREELEAPPIDRELLLQLVRKELPQTVVPHVYRLIHSFDDWRQAFAEAVIDEYRRTHPRGTSEVD